MCNVYQLIHFVNTSTYSEVVLDNIMNLNDHQKNSKLVREQWFQKQ